MAKYSTELNSVTCGGREHFAVEGVMDIADHLRPCIADLIACGQLALAEAGPASEEASSDAASTDSASADGASADASAAEVPKVRKGRR